jgi:hypothetical protein
MKKGMKVKYRTPSGDSIAATVKTVHNDGSATVEATFYLFGGCRESGPYLGYKFRLPINEIRAR